MEASRNEQVRKSSRRSSRRSFLRSGATIGAAAALGTQLAQQASGVVNLGPTSGDAAILRFLAAAEIIETDLWVQYNELGGVQDSEVPGGSGNDPYTEALALLDDDVDIYIHDNTDDEMTHVSFLNAYLAANGGGPVNLDRFRTLPSSKAHGARNIGRLTNLTQLSVDTSWYVRYRASARNPDLGDLFEQAVPGLVTGQFTAIPRTDADLNPKNHLQAIANTAAFHFASIEQGGTSLYAALAQRCTNVEVLRILLSIGGSEIMHFQTWHDVAGHAPPITDPTNKLTFPDFEDEGSLVSHELIMPEPCPFLNRKFPPCSVIRPTETRNAAMRAFLGLQASGLFIGQTPEFFRTMRQLASAADAATR
jgi:hypothetical protein